MVRINLSLKGTLSTLAIDVNVDSTSMFGTNSICYQRPKVGYET
jgi:hypothetical protein